MNILEAEVIEWAIEWTNQVRHGLYRHASIKSHAATELRAAVDRLQAEHDGEWQALIGPEIGVPKRESSVTTGKE